MNTVRGSILWALCVAAPSSAFAFSTTYNAALGSLPTAQGWSLVSTNDFPPATVSGGTLQTGPTSVAGFEYWQVGAPIANFADLSSIRSELRIVSSGWVNNPARSGFNLSLQSPTRFFNLLIASDRIALINNTSGPAVSTYMMDTTSQFRTYELKVSGNSAEVFVDGVSRLTAAQGGVIAGTGLAWFGDGTTLAGGSAQVKWVEANAVPEPSLLLLGVGACWARRRKLRS